MTTSKKFLSNNMIAKIAILSALAFLVMLIESPLWFAPSFYKLDMSEVVVLIGGFALGPVAATIIEAMKILLNLLFTGSSTSGVGEIANFLIGLSFVLPATIYYRRHKDRKHAIIGLIIGTITLTIFGSAMNYFVLIPAYSFFYHMPMEALIGMGTKLIPAIHNQFTFVLLATAPFNLVKGIVSSLLVVLVYKRVSPILHK